MERIVRALDVCVHLLSNRRCLVIAERSDGTAECVYDDDRVFTCPVTQLMSYRHPWFAAAVRRGERTSR